MYDISELEGMKFKELKRLAREKNISRRWTCKREIIDHIIGTGQDENLDMITVTLVDSPDSTKSSSGPEVYDGDGSCVPRQSTARATRSAQPRFPKPRMTVFQEHEGDSPISEAESSYKRNQKYFATPARLRKSKANETFSCSTLEDASEGVSSRKKKSSAHNFASTGTLAVGGVTLRERRRPVTRSYKSRFPCLDLSESTGECYPGFNSTENFGAASGDDEHNSMTSSTRITRKTRGGIADGTIGNLENTNLYPGETSKGKKQNKSLSVSDTIEMPEKEMTVSCSRKRQFNIFRGGVKKEASDTRMKGTYTEQSSPKCNLDETFQIQNESTKSDMSFPLENNVKEQDVQPDSLNDSTGGKRITASPLRMQGHNKTSTPKDDTHDKDDEISDSGSVNAMFELPCPSDVSLHACDMENNKRGRKRRSSSCPHEGTDKKPHSKAVFFSPTATSVAFPASCHPRRGTPLKGTKIPTFVKKMPDFTNIHKKEFEKMESVVDCHQRKLARAKMLCSPKPTKGVQSVMVFTAQSSATKQIPSRNPMAQINVFPNNQMNRNIPQKADGERPHNGRLIQRHDVNEMVKKKLPLQKKRMGEREESRTVIRGVRLNRRFELQMAHRKLN